MKTEVLEKVWGSAVEAARILGSSPKNIARLARSGFITVRRLPGCDPRYLMADVESLAQSMTEVASQKLPASGERQDGAPSKSSANHPAEDGDRLERNGGAR
jgi:hypothetical protein